MDILFRIARTFFWEFIQNLPLAAGLIGGTRLWDRNKWVTVGYLIASGTTSALLIALTEHKIVKGHRESAQMVIGNILAFSTLMIALVVYLHAGWSNWKTDLVIGGCAGFVLDRVQSGRALGRHTIALIVAGGGGLTLIRLCAGLPNWAGSALILTTAITLIVVVFDYAGRIGNSTCGGTI